ncbi:MAG TPA: RNA helicase, partial [Actinomycetota bacterium]|nr:RNA helicase [Actinomycetota bacterium]
TLSLGINMPAKTVVIEDLWKFQGERHELLTPGEYTQLTGRAGRRGIDEHGFAVVVHQRDVDFERVAGLATTRTYELTSSFRPSYNMAVNLVNNYTPDEAHHLLNSSFGQFQADRGVVTLERQLERDRASLKGLRARLKCERGDVLEYWKLREDAERIRRDATRKDDRSRREGVKDALASLRPGDVVFTPRAGRHGVAVVISSRDGRPTLLGDDRRFFRASANHFDDPPTPLARIPMPRSGSVRSARFRRDVAARLVSLNVRPPKQRRRPVDRAAMTRAAELKKQAEEHPVHGCPERAEHEKWAARASKLEREIGGLDRGIRSRTETLARQFDRVLRVLQTLGYVRDFTLTDRGRRLTRIYGEGDIVVSEMIVEGLLEGLSPGEAAGLVSALVYESRERTPREARFPTGELHARFRRLENLWRKVRAAEESHQVELSRELDAGFADTAFQWAEGKPLEDVLRETELAPGDFVRNCKQLIDMLRQIEDVAEGATADVAGAARMALNRGVVAYTGL